MFQFLIRQLAYLQSVLWLTWCDLVPYIVIGWNRINRNIDNRWSGYLVIKRIVRNGWMSKLSFDWPDLTWWPIFQQNYWLTLKVTLAWPLDDLWSLEGELQMRTIRVDLCLANWVIRKEGKGVESLKWRGHEPRGEPPGKPLIEASLWPWPTEHAHWTPKGIFKLKQFCMDIVLGKSIGQSLWIAAFGSFV